MNTIRGSRARVGVLTAAASLALAVVPAMGQPQLSPVILNERFDTYIDNVWTGDCATYTFDGNQAGFEAVWPRDTVAFPPPDFEVNSWAVTDDCATGSRGFSAPVSMRQHKAETHRNVRMLTNEIAAAFPGYTGVNGTLTNPLQLEVYIDADPARWDASQQNIVVELTGPGLGGTDDMAPNSDVIVDSNLVTPCSADVCVQTAPNPRSSIAVGIFANLDPDTCGNCTNPRRTKYLALFDGEQWWQLHENYPVKGCDEPCDGVGIEVSKRRNKIRVTIYADTITVWSDSNEFGVREKKDIPRKYRGPFNRIALGLMVLISDATGLEPGTIDDVYLSGGVGEDVDYTSEGACCLPGGGCEVMEEGACTTQGGVWNRGRLCSQIQCSGACCVPGPQVCIDTDPGSCTSQHGRFNGLGSTCAEVSADCKPIPFADADRDQDVDQRDFAVLQNCFSGTAAYGDPACVLFDRDVNGTGDGDVDEDDFAAFEKCATGPGIAFNFDSPPAGCVP